jgi:small GTP-binding protein
MRRAKIVLVGAAHSGKTSIVNRFLYGEFTLHTVSTTQPAFSQKVMNHKAHAISLEIWDTAGQERYHSLSPLFYRDAEAGIVVFDVTDSDSFGKASKWISELKQERGDGVFVIIAANKTDLEGKRVVDQADGRKLAADWGAPYFETSAKSNLNVQELFTAICEAIVDKMAATSVNKTSAEGKSLKNTVTFQEGEEKKGCC